MGGKERNKHKGKKLKAGRGTVGKTAVVGAKDRKTNKIKARVIKNTDAKTLQKFVADSAAEGATVYTDDAKAYKGMPFDHASVRHSVGEYVRDMTSLRAATASAKTTRWTRCSRWLPRWSENGSPIASWLPNSPLIKWLFPALTPR